MEENETVFSGQKILCVDDNPNNLYILNGLIRHQGYRVYCAQNGEIALKLFKEIEPDLVLLDIMMPVMSGYEVAERMLKIDAEVAVPIIFLSARDEQQSISKAFEIGGVDYVTKPFHEAEICARIKTHLKIRQATIIKNLLIRDLESKLSEQVAGQNENLLQLSQINEVKRDFFTLFAHEIQTPLTVLNGAMKLLDASFENPFDKERLAKILKMASNAQVKIYDRFTDIIDYERYKNRIVESSPIKFTLYSAVEAAMTQVRHPLKEGVEFFNHISRQLEVLQDFPTLKKILARLLDNACKFTDQGKIEVFAEQKEGLIHFKMSDTGCGIAKPFLEKIFQAGNVGHPVSEHQEGGGMGLALCFQIAAFLGGKIEISSAETEPHPGTEVRLLLPCKCETGD
ncbi:hybrid sensor histidine kinase/response regulator [Candidatus Riflebacteria bacterium]